MNGNFSKVSEETRRRVEAIIEASNYRPSSAGSNLRRGTSRILAVIINDRESSYNLEIAASIEEAANRHGKVMILCATQDSPERQDEFLSEMQSQLACGIVMVGAVKSNGLRMALSAGQAIVFVNRRPPFTTNAPYIGVDNRTAASEVAMHFLSLGHKAATILHGPRTSSPTDERVRGFETTFKEQGGSGTKVRKFPLPDFRKESAYALAKSLIEKKELSSAVFCTNDDLAYGVARACREAGMDLQKDITLCGFDGNPYNDYLAPWLSTIKAAANNYGEKVLAALTSIWNGTADSISEDISIPYQRVLRP